MGLCRYVCLDCGTCMMNTSRVCACGVAAARRLATPDYLWKLWREEKARADSGGDNSWWKKKHAEDLEGMALQLQKHTAALADAEAKLTAVLAALPPCPTCYTLVGRDDWDSSIHPCSCEGACGCHDRGL